MIIVKYKNWFKNYLVERSLSTDQLQGTYLGRRREQKKDTKYEDDSELAKTKDKLKKLFKREFLDAKKDEKNYNFKFETNGDSEKVIFPEEFLDKIKNSKDLDDKEKENILTGLKSVVYTIERNNFNRTHFPGGIPKEFKGVGLGYVLYQELVKHLGWASSASNASTAAQGVWSNISTDPDFFAIVTKQDNDGGRILAIDRECESEKIPGVVKKFIDDNKDLDSVTEIVMDGSLVEKYPELKELNLKILRISGAKNFISNFDAIINRSTDSDIEEKISQFKKVILRDLQNETEGGDDFKQKYKDLIRTFESFIDSVVPKEFSYQSTKGLIEESYELRSRRSNPILNDQATKVALGFVILGEDIFKSILEKTGLSNLEKKIKIFSLALDTSQSKILDQYSKKEIEKLQSSWEYFNRPLSTYLVLKSLDPNDIFKLATGHKIAGSTSEFWDSWISTYILIKLKLLGGYSTEGKDFLQELVKILPKLKIENLDNYFPTFGDSKNVIEVLKSALLNLEPILKYLPKNIQNAYFLNSNINTDLEEYKIDLIKKLFQDEEILKQKILKSNLRSCYAIYFYKLITFSKLLELRGDDFKDGDENDILCKIIMLSVERAMGGEIESLEKRLKQIKDRDLTPLLRNSEYRSEWKSWSEMIANSPIEKIDLLVRYNILNLYSLVTIFNEQEKKSDEVVNYIIKNINKDQENRQKILDRLYKLREISTSPEKINDAFYDLRKSEINQEKNIDTRLSFFTDYYPKDSLDNLIDWFRKNAKEEGDELGAIVFILLLSPDKQNIFGKQKLTELSNKILPNLIDIPSISDLKDGVYKDFFKGNKELIKKTTLESIQNMVQTLIKNCSDEELKQKALKKFNISESITTTSLLKRFKDFR